MQTNQMPRINLEALRSQLDTGDYRIALLTINPRTGALRASKPVVKPDKPETGIAAYAWRMAAFSVSPIGQHQCMPVCAEFDLPSGDYDWQSPEPVKAAGRAIREAAKVQGDRIESAIVHSVPVREWHGVYRWGCALGQLGTPQVAPDGAIIYR